MNRRRKKITSTKSPLASILNELPGGWATAFVVLRNVAVRESGSEEAKLMASWEEVHAVHGDATTPEMIAEGASMTTARMLGIIVAACYDAEVSVSRLVAALNLTDAMRRAVKEAKKPDGFKDRQALLQQAGLYPAPASVTINNSPTAIAATRGAIAAGLDAADGLDEFERDTMESTSFLRGLENASEEQRRIESPSSFVNATVVKETVEQKPQEPAP